MALVAVYVGFHLLGELPFGAWGGKLTLGEGLFVLLLAPAFFEPLRDLSGVWHDRASGVAALQALKALAARGQPLPGAEAALEDPQAEAAAPGVAPALAPAVRMRGLAVAHPNAAGPVFESLSLDLSLIHI